MNPDIAFFFNGSSIHTSGKDPKNFSIYPIMDSYTALVSFQKIVNKIYHVVSDEYEIIPHETREWGAKLIDMVSFICLK